MFVSKGTVCSFCVSFNFYDVETVIKSVRNNCTYFREVVWLFYPKIGTDLSQPLILPHVLSYVLISTSYFASAILRFGWCKFVFSK